ncbi:ATPase family AAA domain-containing protein 1 [Magnaporthiopsis poae ATCC 64411]|uniref:ATPase family AAA domain-containing protein 1 n=1 Tax=Magnaporthiopsis poae (strain ATCC 64411 / 73-15) TaxID=644358 RepID=A0A0C4ED39_MAGP6|nr:ATPase family AAA domain-containing protein 1 [Magnaporthiopsis poae ATCC 64411]
MANDTDGGPDGSSSAAPAFNPATAAFSSLEQDFYNHFNTNFHARRHGKTAGAQVGGGKQQATPQSADMAKSAGSTAPSTQAPAAVPPGQANMFSLLCLIASSVLASAAKASAQVDDPPEVVPDDLAGHDAAPAKQQVASAATADPAAPAETCKHCSCSIRPAAETAAAQSGQSAGATKSSSPDSATTEKHTDKGVAPNDAPKSANDKTAPKTTSSDGKPASDDQVAKPQTTAQDETTADGASTPEPQTPTEHAAPSVEISPDETPATAEDGAAAGEGEDAAAENAEADATPAVEEPAKPEPPKPEPTAINKTLPPPPPPGPITNTNPLKLPDWFLGNNVVLLEDLAKRPSMIELFKPKPGKKAAGKPDADGNVSESPAESTAVSSAADTAQTTPESSPTSTPPSEPATEPESKVGDQAESTPSDTKEATAAVGPDVKPEQKAAADNKDEQPVDSAAATTATAAEPSPSPGPAKTEATEVVCSCKKAAALAAADLAKTGATPGPASDKSAEADKPASQRPVYQLHQDIYDEALDLLSAALQPPAKAASDNSTKKALPESWITQSSFLVQSPKDGSLEFLDEVMRQIGRDVQADMITIELDDLEDLAHHFWKESDEVRAVGPKYLTSPLRLVGEFFGYGKPEEKSKAAVTCILEGPAKKRESLAGASAKASADKATEAKTGAAVASVGGKAVAAAAGNPADAADILQVGVKDAFEAATKILQAAIREAFATVPKPAGAATTSDSQRDATAEGSVAEAAAKQEAAARDEDASPTKPRPLIVLFRNVEDVGKQTPLQRLVEGVNKVRRETGLPVVIVGTAVAESTSEFKGSMGISKAWDGLGLDDSTVVNVSPRNTKRASVALKQHGARTRPRVKWRLLRRAIRVTLDEHPTVKVDALYPSGPASGESTVDELEDEQRRQTLADWDDALSARVVRQVCARAVRAGAVTPADVFDVMERVLKNQAIMDRMNDAGDDEFVGEDDDSAEEEVGAGGPVKKSKVKTLLDSIVDSCSDAEKEYFDCVVDTVAVSSAAQDIHMDQALMDSLKQLLSLRTSKPYGLLAKEAVNGAILYGPPGTGKTHLARVVAASSGTNLIVATPADIQNMWVGETEKRIKALFSLGSKLAPCVIFLDEGDSVFGRRQSRDRDWQRKAMSQFLMEMDGLVSRKKAPFLMVATNRPGDIDEAVCRRLPHTLHIGMPTTAGRRAILDIYLKDEKLDEKLDLDEVAADSMTKGFSGSDIRTLCVQAAMAAHKALEADNKAKADEGGGEPDNAEDKSGTQKRVIKMEHFKIALERTRPSVTRESLIEIERFTGQQDEGDHRAMYI